MKRMFLLATLMVSVFSISLAQVKDAKTAKAEVAKVVKSKLVCENPDANLGKVPQNIPATAVYKLKNMGDKPIMITNVRTSCGCTSKSYSKEPIKPGESTTVEASYNARSLGNFYKTVTVTTNEGIAPMVFKIRGTVEAKKEEKK